jgi:hypothetical protein
MSNVQQLVLLIVLVMNMFACPRAANALGGSRYLSPPRAYPRMIGTRRFIAAQCGRPKSQRIGEAGTMCKGAHVLV